MLAPERPVFDAIAAGGMLFKALIMPMVWASLFRIKNALRSRALLLVLIVPLALSLAKPAIAQDSPVGTWQSIDDATGKPRAEVRITQTDGVHTGRIVRSLQPTPLGALEVCVKCTDDRKDKPLIGLDIIRNIKRNADTPTWEGGEILDPDKGKTYKLQLQLLDGGKKLQVRGYIGPFFRNQTWLRVSSSESITP